jgi:hypothetical protein
MKGERPDLKAALEEKMRPTKELLEKQRRIAELQALAERGTPRQRTAALRKLHEILRGEEKK